MKAVLLALVLVHSTVQEEQPYKYYNQPEYQYWHTPAANQVADTRRPSLRRQLTDLLGPGVPPAMLFSTAGVGNGLSFFVSSVKKIGLAK